MPTTETRANPAAASKPTLLASSRRPEARRALPRTAWLPCLSTELPANTGAIAAMAPGGSGMACSSRTTASAPAGRGSPLATATATPGATPADAGPSLNGSGL